MVNKKVIFLFLIIIFSITSVGQAATLNFGEDKFKVQLNQFNPQGTLNEFMMLSLGYGVNDYSGYGLEIISGNQKGMAHLEYQFVPPPKRESKRKFNYAVKAGAASGNYWDEKDSAGKVGLILAKETEEKEIYFDSDIIQGEMTVFDLELGVRGEIADGILGVLGYKVVASQEEGTIRGAHYGLKVTF